MSMFNIVRLGGGLLILGGGIAYGTLNSTTDTNIAWQALKSVCEPNVGKGHTGQRRMFKAAHKMDEAGGEKHPFTSKDADGSRTWVYEKDGADFSVEIGRNARHCMVQVDVSQRYLDDKVAEDGGYRKAEGCTFEGERISKRRSTRDINVGFYQHKEDKRLILMSIAGSTTPGWYLYRAASSYEARKELEGRRPLRLARRGGERLNRRSPAFAPAIPLVRRCDPGLP